MKTRLQQITGVYAMGLEVSKDADCKWQDQPKENVVFDADFLKTEEADTAWFTQHPDRSSYLRPTLPHETKNFTPGRYAILVTQIRAGVWTRIILGLKVKPERFCRDASEIDCKVLTFGLMRLDKEIRLYMDHINALAGSRDEPTIKEVLADDEQWFEEHGGLRRRVRRSSAVELRQCPGSNIVIVSQIEQGMRTRRHTHVSADLIDYVLENGDACIGMDQGEPFIILPPR
jgi:hypothetical protein